MQALTVIPPRYPFGRVQMQTPADGLRPLGLLIVTALALTAIVLFLIIPAAGKAASGQYKLGFADGYDRIASSIAGGTGYRLAPELGETMMREPGYPLLLAAAFRVFGRTIESARVLNLVLAALAAWMLWRLALRITGEPRVALAAVGLFLAHPGTIVAEARGGVEMVFTCALVAFLAALYWAMEADRGKRYFAAGLVLGVAVLVRSTPLLFPLILTPYLVLSAPRPARARRLAQCALLVTGVVLVMSPWVARNYLVSGEPVLTATVLGVSAQEGQYTCQRLEWASNHKALQTEAAHERNRIATQLGLRFQPAFYQYFYSPREEFAFHRALLAQVLVRYQESPALLARCVGQNAFNFWFLGQNGLSTVLNLAVQGPLLILSVAGIVALRRRRPTAALVPVLLFAGYLMAVHLPIMVHARHSVPLVPFLAVFAAAALVLLRDQFAARAPAPVRPAGA